MIELFECVDLAESTDRRVDRERGVIHDVKVLGWKSANGREYLPAGVDPGLYEGRVICCDHARPGAERSAKDRVGWLEGVEKRPGGLYAARLRLLNPSGEFEQRLMTAAEHAPHLFGLSHTARGRQRPGHGPAVIEAVESVQSVDLVGDPATVAGLYESRGSQVKKKLSALAQSLKTTRPGYSRALTEMAEAGVMSPDATMDEPAPMDDAPQESGDHEQALKDGFKAALSAVLDDDSMDTKAKLAKMKEIMQAQEKLLGGDKGKKDPPAESEPAESDTEESIHLDAYRQLGRKGIRLTALHEKAIQGCRTKKDVSELVESLVPGQGRHSGARSATPVVPARKAGTTTTQESRQADSDVPADGKSLGKWLSSK